MNRRRILSLRLPRLPTDRIRRQLLRRAATQTASAAPDDDIFNQPLFHQPWVVANKLSNALQIVALDDAAAAIGLETGLPIANARAICPELQVFDHDEAADAQTLSDIADWCDRFTPLVALDPPAGLLLDISGCAHLFGGEANMLRAVCSSLRRQGFAVSVAIAGTPACARAMAYAMNSRIVPDGEEAKAVGSLSVSALGVSDTITRGLRRAGLKTIGDVAARAPHEITARFGAAFTALLQETLGRCDAPISSRKPPPDFMTERRFAEPVTTQEVIAAALSLLAHTLVFAMERHGRGARLLEANFFRTDGTVRTIAVEAGQPVTHAHVVDRLFRERLDALADPLDPGFGFDLIRLSARRVDIVVQAQRDFDTSAQENDDVAALIDRIAARIGPRRVVVHLPQDTHSPEKAVRAVPAQRHLPDAVQAVWPERYAGEPPLRPLRMFEPPEKIDVTAMFPDGPPAQFTWRKARHRIANVEGPERIAMEWWTRPAHLQDSNDTRTRDYFRIEDQEGCRFWLYREGIYQREVKTFRWFLQGVFA
ncbi:MAG TPA: DNA polymerase Y family protein [Afipia sp.]